MKYTRKCKVAIQQNQGPTEVRLFEPGVDRRVSLIVDRGDREHLVPGTHISMDEFHRYQLLGRQLQAQAMASAFLSLYRAASRTVKKLAAAYRQASLQAAAARELGAMNDHLLQDIGIRREDIPAAVEGLMNGQTVTQAEPAQAVPQTPLPQLPACNQPHGKAAA